MISKYVREQKRYTQENLREIFECTAEKTIIVIRKLKEYGIIKTVKATDKQKDMSDLIEEDIEVTDVELGENQYLYVFTFVGVITVAGCVLKCYPKYISKNTPTKELKQIIKVLEKYNNKKKQIINMYNDSEESRSFNLLALMIFLLNDYYENGVYTNTHDILEKNGSGEIVWDKTINETFTFLSNNRPYYTELITKKRVMDDFDYFKRLHECILSHFTKELKEADLLELFDIMPVELSDEVLGDFGDIEYIQYRIEKELSVQFNSLKQLVLKSMYAFITQQGSLSSVDGLSMFGTNSFNLVWEWVCSDVMDNQLKNTLGSIKLPKELDRRYNPTDTLISIIEKPKWVGVDAGALFIKTANDTLVPDIISIHTQHDEFEFIIFDAKYYIIQLDVNRELRGHPGISDIIKQYLYQMAFKDFIELHNFNGVKNCFLMPTEEEGIINKGYTKLKMLDELGLQYIQIRQLPAREMYEYYLNGDKIDIAKLSLKVNKVEDEKIKKL